MTSQKKSSIDSRREGFHKAIHYSIHLYRKISFTPGSKIITTINLKRHVSPVLHQRGIGLKR